MRYNASQLLRVGTLSVSFGGVSTGSEVEIEVWMRTEIDDDFPAGDFCSYPATGLVPPTSRKEGQCTMCDIDRDEFAVPLAVAESPRALSATGEENGYHPCERQCTD